MRALTAALVVAGGVASVLVGCDPEASSLPPASQCEENEDCRDDGLFCNGRPSCEEQTFTTSRGPWMVKLCMPGDPPCGADSYCSEADGSCTCVDPDQDDDGADSNACGGTDCDDDDPERAPGRTEICDPDDRDEDCDPSTFGFRDSDIDGSPDASCCNGDNCGEDCDDSRPGIHPRAVEACDERDNDCDTGIDEGVLADLYEDEDGDGFGAGDSSQECADAAGYTSFPGDCDDDNPYLHVGTFRCKDDGDSSDVERCEDGDWEDDSCPGDGLCVPQPGGAGVCLPGDEFPECSDGEDNDDDDQVDWSDANCSSPLDNTENERGCDDGNDDDDDGLVDYPNDPGCSSLEDDDEEDPATPPACANGLDDDNDGAVDFVPDGAGDPGCLSASDGNERQADGPSCDNGVDDDEDGTSDYPGDKSCADRASEEAPCANGLDDDHDGEIDLDDPGCLAADDISEREVNGPACDNDADDDMDGPKDFPGDIGCTGPTDAAE